MPIARHNPKVPGNPLKPTSPDSDAGRNATQDELRAALDVITAAAANLQHYRDRLSPDDYITTVRDIEQAANQIASGLAAEPSPRHGTMPGWRRRAL